MLLPHAIGKKKQSLRAEGTTEVFLEDSRMGSIWVGRWKREDCGPGNGSDCGKIPRIWTILLGISLPSGFCSIWKDLNTSEEYPFVPSTYPVCRLAFYSVSQGISKGKILYNLYTDGLKYFCSYNKTNHNLVMIVICFSFNFFL